MKKNRLILFVRNILIQLHNISMFACLKSVSNIIDWNAVAFRIENIHTELNCVGIINKFGF